MTEPESEFLQAQIWYLEIRSYTHDAQLLLPEGYSITYKTHVDLPEYLALYQKVGEGLTWFARLYMTSAELEAYFQSEQVQVYYLLDPQHQPIGILEYEIQNTEIEILYFGIIASHLRRGLGRAFMHNMLQQLWQSPLIRIWLHTCSYDHPRALDFYQQMGFHIFHQSEVMEKVPHGYHPRYGRSET